MQKLSNNLLTTTKKLVRSFARLTALFCYFLARISTVPTINSFIVSFISLVYFDCVSNILARVAWCHVRPVVSFFKINLSNKLCQDPMHRFSLNFHRMVSFWGSYGGQSFNFPTPSTLHARVRPCSDCPRATPTTQSVVMKRSPSCITGSIVQASFKSQPHDHSLRGVVCPPHLQFAIYMTTLSVTLLLTNVYSDIRLFKQALSGWMCALAYVFNGALLNSSGSSEKLLSITGPGKVIWSTVCVSVCVCSDNNFWLKWSLTSTCPCSPVVKAVEHNVFRSQGSNLSPDTSTYKRIFSNHSYAHDEQGDNPRQEKRVRRCLLLAVLVWLKQIHLAGHWLVQHTAPVRAKPDSRSGLGTLQISNMLFTFT